MVIETLFHYRGIGALIYSAARTKDFPMLEAGVLTVGVVYALASVLAAPADLRAGAAVLGYNPQGELVKLREGQNELICLATDPGKTAFSVACYRHTLEGGCGRQTLAAARAANALRAHRYRFRCRHREIDGRLPAMGRLCALRHTGIHGTVDQAQRQCAVADVPRNCGCPHHDQPAKEVKPAVRQHTRARRPIRAITPDAN